MDNPETFATLGTPQDTGKRQKKNTTQKTKKMSTMRVNPGARKW